MRWEKFPRKSKFLGVLGLPKDLNKRTRPFPSPGGDTHDNTAVADLMGSRCICLGRNSRPGRVE